MTILTSASGSGGRLHLQIGGEQIFPAEVGNRDVVSCLRAATCLPRAFVNERNFEVTDQTTSMHEVSLGMDQLDVESPRVAAFAFLAALTQGDWGDELGNGNLMLEVKDHAGQKHLVRLTNSDIGKALSGNVDAALNIEHDETDIFQAIVDYVSGHPEYGEKFFESVMQDWPEDLLLERFVSYFPEKGANEIDEMPRRRLIRVLSEEYADSAYSIKEEAEILVRKVTSGWDNEAWQKYSHLVPKPAPSAPSGP
jgi:hypothetical protein